MLRTIQGAGLKIIYGIGIFLVSPIILFFIWPEEVFPFQGYIQVFFSGPLLLSVGIILFFGYKKRVSGLLFFGIGFCLLCAIAYELYDYLS